MTIRIEIDSMLPEQFHAPQRYTPEQRLCLAVLEAVVEDLPRRAVAATTSNRRRHSPREHALHYIHTRDPRWPFSFDNVCTQLGIDPDAFREALDRRAA